MWIPESRFLSKEQVDDLPDASDTRYEAEEGLDGCHQPLRTNILVFREERRRGFNEVWSV